MTNDVEADEASHVQGADGVGAGCLAQAAAEQSPDHPRLCTIPVLLNSQRASVTQTPESALLCSCPRRQFTGPAFGHNPCHVLVDAYEGVYQLAHHLLLDLLSTVRGVLTGGASDKFIQLLISHLEPCLIRMVRGDMVWGSNTTMVSTEMEMREAITSSSNPLCDNKFDTALTNKCVSQLPIHYMATSTWKKVEPDMICEDEFDKDVFYNDDEAIAKVAVHDTGGSVLKTLFPGLVQESLPSSSSVKSGPWAKVIEYTHIHAQHSPYDTVTWQKQVVKVTKKTPPPSPPISCRARRSSPGGRFSCQLCPLAPPLTTACPTSSSGPRRSPPGTKWTSPPTSPLSTGAPPPLPSSYRPMRSSDKSPHLNLLQYDPA